MSGLLSTLLAAFWRMCCLRMAPQDLPRAHNLMIVTMLANASLTTLVNQLVGPLPQAVRLAALELLVMAGLTSALLYAFARRGRIVQTITALMGTGSVIGAAMLLAMIFVPQLPQSAHFVFFLWNIVVIGHILRHAFDTPLVVGVMSALGYAFLLSQLELFVNRLLIVAPA